MIGDLARNGRGAARTDLTTGLDAVPGGRAPRADRHADQDDDVRRGGRTEFRRSAARSRADDRDEERTQIFGHRLLDPVREEGSAADSGRHAVPGRRAARRAAEREAAERVAAERAAAERAAVEREAVEREVQHREAQERAFRERQRRGFQERELQQRASAAADPARADDEEDAGSRRPASRRRASARSGVPNPRGPEASEPGLRVPAPRGGGSSSRRPTAVARRGSDDPDATGLYQPVRPISDAVLSTTDLIKVHGQGMRSVTALDGITLNVQRGRFTAIMGASGSGKSTLLHCLAGLDKPTRGKVLLGTTDLTRVSERKLTRLRRDRIGFVFQSYDLLPQLTVRQNILLPVEVAGAKVDQPWMDTVLEALELGDLLRQLPAQLSGGEQQRVAVARAVLSRPDVVLADEPTGALDAGTTREMVGFLRASVDHLGQTVVMVTHDPLAAQHADRAVILHAGRLVGEVAQPTAHGVLDALAALADAPEPAGPDRRTSAPGRRSARRRSRWPSLGRRAARHT